MGGEDYHQYNMISLSGVYAPSKNPRQGRTPAVLDRYLEQHPNTKNIVIHFDNDSKGRAAEKVIANKLKDRYKVVDYPPPSGKDFNDFLCLYRRKQLSINRYRGTLLCDHLRYYRRVSADLPTRRPYLQAQRLV